MVLHHLPCGLEPLLQQRNGHLVDLNFLLNRDNVLVQFGNRLLPAEIDQSLFFRWCLVFFRLLGCDQFLRLCN